MSFFEDDPVGPALKRTARAIETEGSALLRGLRAVATGATSLAFAPAALGLGTLTVASVGAAAALRSITSEATGLARVMASLRANQGLSSAQTFGLTSRNSLFGISPEQTAQMYGGPGMNPMFAGIRGAVTGFGNPYSANYLPQAAERYQALAQSGPMGRIFANRMLDASQGGQASDELRQTLNLRPAQIRAQLAYGAQVQSQMGISPEMLRRFSEEIPLASQRLAFAVDMAKVKLATELAPAIENGVGSVAQILAANSGKIAGAIETGTHYLVYDLPPLLLRGSAQVLRGGAFLLDGLSTVAKGLAGNVRPILTVFDAIIDGARSFTEGLGGVVAFIVQGAGMIWKAVQSTGLPKLAQDAGKLITQKPNDTPENRLANGIVGGAALKYGVLPAAGATVGILAQRALTGGAARSATTAVAAVANTNPYAYGNPTGRVGVNGPLRPLGQGAARTGVATGATPGGLARALSLPAILAGTVLGVGGYELMRRYDIFGYGSMPSTAQIIGTYSGATDSPTQQARASHEARQRALRAQAEARRNPLSAFGYQEGRNPFDAIGDGRSAVASLLGGQSNLANNPALIGNLERLFGSAGESAGSGSRSLLGLADKADAAANSWKKERDEDMRRILREIAINTKEGANAQRALNHDMPLHLQNMFSRVMAYIAEDAALNVLHIG